MAKIKLTKTAVEAAQPQAKDVELRDTVVPGFLCKITPTGRRVFMLQNHTNSGQPRKPSQGLYGDVEQARVKAQDWLAEVRQGGDPPAVPRSSRLNGIGSIWRTAAWSDGASSRCRHSDQSAGTVPSCCRAYTTSRRCRSSSTVSNMCSNGSA